MSDDRSPPPAPDGAASPAARAAAAERRASARRAMAVADLRLGTVDRLDDRTRTAAALLLDQAIGAIARDIASVAARRLPDAALLQVDVSARLDAARLSREPGLVAEAIAQSRAAQIDAALLASRPPSETPTLLSRLLEAGDRVVRARATAYLVSDNRRRQGGAELPEEWHRRVAWWTAAALREHIGAIADRALADGVARSLAARREGGDALAAAAQLAVAIDAPVSERPHLLLDALGEGRTDLFAALLAHALAIDPAEVRAIVIDPDGELLWLALRAAGLSREDIARIGWALCAADPARDVEQLPDEVDAVGAVTPDAARDALAMLSLPAEYRAAILALDGAAA